MAERLEIIGQEDKYDVKIYYNLAYNVSLMK